ncbi:MAG: 30S ribosomal protein S9 [Candidatus Neomarinimicrobiota bacterium]|nr:MAG: 30S ribosomal protein S9 [Candidatus Neomarinimicrobiota bacterium]
MSETTFYGTGRRKRSVARVYLSPGKGELRSMANHLEITFAEIPSTIVMQPLVAVEGEKAFDIEINVNGGGLTGQAGAIRLGISRALLDVNSEYRSVLKEKGYLTRDARKGRAEKAGQPGAKKLSILKTIKNYGSSKI